VKKFIACTGLFVVFIACFATSCKKKEKKDPYAEWQGNYFSIRQFALDEWNTFAGEPFVIMKTISEGPKIDTTYTNSDTINWAPIFETFFAAEISDRKYLGQYNFTQFDDNDDGTHNFFYEAKEDDLFTRKLLITIDGYTQMVRGIYVETEKGSLGASTIQKLYYRPMKTIQIQTIEKSLFGSKKHTVVQYDFMRSEK
jgi:hypothetical protein